MKFKNIQYSEDGTSVNFDVEATADETAFLVNHAVNHLLTSGLIALNNVETTEQEISLDEVKH